MMDLMYEYGGVISSNTSKKAKDALSKQGKVFNSDSLQLLTKPGHFDKLLAEIKK